MNTSRRRRRADRCTSAAISIHAKSALAAAAAIPLPAELAKMRFPSAAERRRWQRQWQPKEGHKAMLVRKLRPFRIGLEALFEGGGGAPKSSAVNIVVAFKSHYFFSLARIYVCAPSDSFLVRC